MATNYRAVAIFCFIMLVVFAYSFWISAQPTASFDTSVERAN